MTVYVCLPMVTSAAIVNDRTEGPTTIIVGPDIEPSCFYDSASAAVLSFLPAVIVTLTDDKPLHDSHDVRQK